MLTLGAIPIRGNLSSLDIIKRENRQKDAIIYLAVSLAGPDGKIRDYGDVIQTDGAAVDTTASTLEGIEKPSVITSGTLVISPDPSDAETTENSPLRPNPLNQRNSMLLPGLTRASRYARFVWRCTCTGEVQSGIRMLMQMAYTGKETIYIDDGSTRTSVIYVEDAAALYLLVVARAKPGDIFNGTCSTNVTSKQLAEAIGEVLELPACSKTFEEAEIRVGLILARVLMTETGASSAKAVKELGWKPQPNGVLEEIKGGSYVAVAGEFRNGAV